MDVVFGFMLHSLSRGVVVLKVNPPPGSDQQMSSPLGQVFLTQSMICCSALVPKVEHQWSTILCRGRVRLQDASFPAMPALRVPSIRMTTQ